MEKLPSDPEKAAKEVVDQAKRQYTDGDFRKFRKEALDQMEKKG